MALIWKLAVLSLWPVAVAAHIATRTPDAKPVGKPFTDRAPTSQPGPATPWEEAKSYTICAIAGAENCWQTGGKPRR